MTRLALPALLLLTVAAWLGLRHVDFAWDDGALVVDNVVTASLWDRRIWTEDLWSTMRLPAPPSGYWRPLFLLTLAIDRALFGLDAPTAHLHDLLWHLASVLLLHRLLRVLAGALPALAGAALFALHPVQVEALALVAARNDLMASAFLLAALVLLVDQRPGWLRLGGAALATSAALLSKESAALAPLFLLALDLGRHGRPVGWPRYAALAAGLGAWLGLRLALADVATVARLQDAAWSTLGDRLPAVAATYASLLVWPWPLTPARHLSWLQPLPAVLPGLLALVALGALATWRGRQRGLVLAGLAWAVLAFAPTLYATVDKGLLGERYLYLPLAGLALALAGALPERATAHRASTPLVLGLALLAGLAVRARLEDWRTSLTLWEAAHRDLPSPFTAGGLAFYVNRAGDPARASDLYREALAGDPPYLDVCLAAAIAANESRRPGAEAAAFIRWSFSRGCPAHGGAHDQLALALVRAADWDAALAASKASPGGLTSQGLGIMAARAWILGDSDTFQRVRAAWPGPGQLEVTVIRLLRFAGAQDAADALRRAANDAPLRTP